MENYRVCILGDSGVGKTKLFEAYSHSSLSAPGLVNLFVTEEQGRVVEWWDFAGSQTYEGVRRMMYTFFDGCVLVYDLSNCNSYRNLHKWEGEIAPWLSLPETKAVAPVLVVGNKADLAQEAIKYSLTAPHTVACAATGAIDSSHWRSFLEEMLDSPRKADLIRANKLLEVTIRPDIGVGSDSPWAQVWRWVRKKFVKSQTTILPR